MTLPRQWRHCNGSRYRVRTCTRLDRRRGCGIGAPIDQQEHGRSSDVGSCTRHAGTRAAGLDGEGRARRCVVSRGPDVGTSPWLSVGSHLGVGGVAPGTGPDGEETRPDAPPWSLVRSDRGRLANFGESGHSIDPKRIAAIEFFRPTIAGSRLCIR